MTPHAYELRVYYEDTDAGGIVYHANYLRFAERARTEMLREAGLDHRRLAVEHGGTLAVTRCDARFRAPARLDDRLRVETTLVEAAGARLALHQDVLRGGEVLAAIDVALAFLGPDLRPRRLPSPLRNALTALAQRAPLA